MACKVSRDDHGAHYHIDEVPHVKTPGAKHFAGCGAVDVWWDRDPLRKADEDLIIRQDNGAEDGHPADTIILTQGQVYDLIDALNKAMERP